MTNSSNERSEQKTNDIVDRVNNYATCKSRFPIVEMFQQRGNGTAGCLQAECAGWRCKLARGRLNMKEYKLYDAGSVRGGERIAEKVLLTRMPPLSNPEGF